MFNPVAICKVDGVPWRKRAFDFGTGNVVAASKKICMQFIIITNVFL